jgi:hypothetical protein
VPKGAVEEDFIVPVYLSDCLLPFRLTDPVQAVIPWDGKRLLDGDYQLGKHRGLAKWWHDAEGIWNQGRKGKEVLTLLGQLDYRRKLTDQFPIPGLRVVYSKSGTRLTAAIVEDGKAIIDCQLYWGKVQNRSEASFLIAILNSDILTRLVRPLQARGQYGPRHFDKLPFEYAIPVYDGADPDHRRLIELAERAESVASRVTIPAKKAQRGRVRRALEEDGVAAEIEEIVKALLAG